FVAANGTLLTRLNYTSHIPCNGVEEPKSVESYGLGLQIVLDGPEGTRIGFGSEPGDLSVAGAERALAKARAAAVHDPEFVSLPRPGREKRVLTDYHDRELMAVSDERLVECGWTIVNGALRTFLNSSRLADFSDEAGVQAAQAAIDAVGGERVPSGRYTVVFGRQPVTDILNDLIIPACNSDAFYASATPFLGRLGQRVTSPLLSIYDD